MLGNYHQDKFVFNPNSLGKCKVLSILNKNNSSNGSPVLLLKADDPHTHTKTLVICYLGMRFFQIEFLEILHMAIYQTSSSIWDMTKKEIPCILECNTCCRRWRLRLQFPPCRSDVFTVCLCTNFWRAINCWSVIPSTSETSLYCVLEKKY